jgi:hypothetical protein
MFSNELVDAICKEAETLGLRGATPITVALRTQLTQRKRFGQGVSDERHRTYWLAGRVVDAGVSYPVPGVAEITGLAQAGALGEELLRAHHTSQYSWDVPGHVLNQTPAARVNLTRKGEAHFSVVTHALENGPPDSWLDLYVFNDPQRAEDFAAKLPTGKVF